MSGNIQIDGTLPVKSEITSQQIKSLYALAYNYALWTRQRNWRPRPSLGIHDVEVLLQPVLKAYNQDKKQPLYPIHFLSEEEAKTILADFRNGKIQRAVEKSYNQKMKQIS